MNEIANNGNGSQNLPTGLEGGKIEYPITFELKAVMLGTENDDDNMEKLIEVFKKLGIVYQYRDKKLSSKGAYVSYTFVTTLTSKSQMDSMYEELKKIKELKFAV
jgi:putative lipoic acid-binding regulatory protein